MTKRLQETLSQLQPEANVGLIPYLTVGFPSVEATLSLVPALQQAGATIVELGIPFSDPIAEGPTIQASSYQALKQGVTIQTCLDVCRTLRDRGVTIPLLFMGYYNPILSYGVADFAKAAGDAGADGVIVPDLPPEEASQLRNSLKIHHLILITMLAPTSTEKRIAFACREAEGFIYCVSVAGVTGARSSVPEGLFDYLARVRLYTSLPLAVGFGISTRSQVKSIGAHAEAVVVGSKLIAVLDSSAPEQRIAYVTRFIEELTGKGPEASSSLTQGK